MLLPAKGMGQHVEALERADGATLSTTSSGESHVVIPLNSMRAFESREISFEYTLSICQVDAEAHATFEPLPLQADKSPLQNPIATSIAITEESLSSLLGDPVWVGAVESLLANGSTAMASDDRSKILMKSIAAIHVLQQQNVAVRAYTGVVCGGKGADAACLQSPLRTWLEYSIDGHTHHYDDDATNGATSRIVFKTLKDIGALIQSKNIDKRLTTSGTVAEFKNN